MPRPVCPPIAADVITEIGNRIVLIERKNFPEGWAIPGGFVDFGETVEQAAMREAKEEISLDGRVARAARNLFAARSRPARPDYHRGLHRARERNAGRRRRCEKLRAVRSAQAAASPLAFDHAEILRDYVRFLDTGEYPAPWKKK